MSYYNLKEFGQCVRHLREIRYRQFDIQNLSGIHPDTMRKIENGLVIPKLETLEELSDILGIDLVKLLISYRNFNNNVFLYYIDNFMFGRFLLDLNSLNQIKLKISKESKARISNQCNYLIIALIYYMDNDIASLENAKRIIIKAIESNNYRFEFKSLSKYLYNDTELRCLILLSKIYCQTKDYYKSSSILQICLKQAYEKNEKTITAICFLTLITNFILLNEYSNALINIEIGFFYAQHTNNLFFFTNLCFLKSIVTFTLNNKNYKLYISMTIQISKLYLRV